MSSNEQFALELYHSRVNAKAAVRPHKTNSKLSIDDAYAIQNQLVKLLDQEVCGYKIGFGYLSQEAKRKERVFGRLSSQMQISSGGKAFLSSYVHLCSENEIALVMAEDVREPIGDVTVFQTKIAEVAPAIEMPDKNFQDFGSMTGLDLISNNAISGAFLVGNSKPLAAVNLQTVTVQTTWNNEIVEKGCYANIPANPIESAHWLSLELLNQGNCLRKGDVILTGSMGKAFTAQVGRYTSHFNNLGVIEFSVTD